jgi:hypothetical protein
VIEVDSSYHTCYTQTAASIADASARLSEDVRELMASIGRDWATDHDMIWEIYNYTGHAVLR